MMKNLVSIILLTLFNCLNLNAQCSYTLNNLTNVNCYGDNTGEIGISVINGNATYWWQLPSGATSNSNLLTDLYAGDYVINIMENFTPGDTTSPVVCYFTDTIRVEQTIDIFAVFSMKNLCSALDSADITTKIYGGTRQYSTLWTQLSDTSRNIMNLPPSNIPYIFNITDANGCQKNQYLNVNNIQSMQTFMLTENVICKDDNSGSVSVFVQNGTPPFIFTWNTGETMLSNDRLSTIYNLYPGKYTVSIKDTMGCSYADSIELFSNPKTCINIYKVFSPNEDGINDFWRIDNIHLYPDALIEIYDRLGNVVYRRRNYINSEQIAFNGKLDNRRLPSGTYYYVVNLENEQEVFKGTLTIVR